MSVRPNPNSSQHFVPLPLPSLQSPSLIRNLAALFVAAACATTTSFQLRADEKAAAPPSPNVVFIVAEDE